MANITYQNYYCILYKDANKKEKPNMLAAALLVPQKNIVCQINLSVMAFQSYNIDLEYRLS